MPPTTAGEVQPRGTRDASRASGTVNFWAALGGRILTWLGRHLPSASTVSLYAILFVTITVGDFFVEFSALIYRMSAA